jgi:ubiquinone/menaquinone biosynthesis C-methylase UbiE
MDTHARDRTDFDALFDADNYLYFNQDHLLTEKRTRDELRFLRENLGLSKTTSLLDLACGHGRHANALAKELRSVVGLDTNARFLEIARIQSANEGSGNVTFINKDIRQLDYFAEFERATMLNTVFGLFSDDENHDLLLRINRALKAFGQFCFDVINRDTILVDFQPDYILEKEGNLLLDRCSFDQRTGRMTNKRIYLRNGCMTHACFSIRLYNYTEIDILLAATCFKIVSVFADWHANPIVGSSKKIVIIAQKTSDAK